jgi:hypothetical protein
MDPKMTITVKCGTELDMPSGLRAKVHEIDQGEVTVMYQSGDVARMRIEVAQQIADETDRPPVGGQQSDRPIAPALALDMAMAGWRGRLPPAVALEPWVAAAQA